MTLDQAYEVARTAARWMPCAEDAAQEAVIAFVRAGGDALDDALAVTVIRRAAISAYRWERRRRRPSVPISPTDAAYDLDDVEPAITLASGDDAPDAALEMQSEVEHVRRLARMLPIKERMVLQMVAGGHTLASAGRATGLTEARASQLVSAATGRLRTMVAA